MTKVELDVATITIEDWLDHKKIGPIKREKYSGMIDNLIEAVQTGNLVLNEDKSLTLIPAFPIVGINSEIVFKSRITETDKEKYKKIIKADDFKSSMMIALLALTDIPMGSIKSMDESTDRQVAESIAVFFL